MLQRPNLQVCLSVMRWCLFWVIHSTEQTQPHILFLPIFLSSNVFLCRTSMFSLSFNMFYCCKFSSIHHLIPKVSRPKISLPNREPANLRTFQICQIYGPSANVATCEFAICSLIFCGLLQIRRNIISSFQRCIVLKCSDSYL